MVDLGLLVAGDHAVHRPGIQSPLPGLFLVVDDVEEERMEPLWVKGRIAWSGEADEGRYVAGARFEVITDQQKAWIRQVLAHPTSP